MTPTTRLWQLGVLISFIGLVMYVVGFSTDWWCQLDNENYAPVSGARINAHFGLWRKCITISINQSGTVISDGCEDMDNDDTALAIIGCAVYIGKAKDTDDRLEVDYSSFLALIGSIVAAAGGICQLLSIRTGYYTLA